MNKIILALTFLIVALVGAGAVAASCDADNATADNLNECMIDAPTVDTAHTTDAIAVENESGDVDSPVSDVCVNDSCGELKNTEKMDVALQERPSSDVHLGKMINMTPVKNIKFKVAAKQSVVKVSKNTLTSIKSLYGSHTLESIGMAVGLTPAQTKNIIKEMKAGKHGSAYKKVMLKIDKAIKNTKNAKYLIN